MGKTRITAEFDTIDSADWAAAALRRRVDGILDITCTPRHQRRDEGDDNFFLAVPAAYPGFAAGMTMSGAYLPVVFGMGADAEPDPKPSSGEEAILTVEVKDEYAHSAESLLRSLGGLSMNSLSL